MGLIRVTTPTFATEPLTLVEVRAHLREPVSGDAVADAEVDTYIQTLVATARAAAEARCQRTIAAADWKLTLDAFPPQISLPMPRVTAVTQIDYRDPGGTLVLLDSAGYTLDSESEYSNWIYPAFGYSWPQTWTAPNGVTVYYTAGWAQAEVPAEIKMWMKLAIGAWYDVRSGMDVAPLPMQAFELPPQFFQSLLEPWMVMLP